MSSHAFTFCNEDFLALPSGALFWPAQRLLCVSDLHFGKASRYALHGASVLPPYEVYDTLLRLDQDIAEQRPKAVICLGDSFDRVGASDDLDPRAREWIIRLQAGVNWIWIEGNHDPGPLIWVALICMRSLLDQSFSATSRSGKQLRGAKYQATIILKQRFARASALSSAAASRRMRIGSFCQRTAPTQVA